MEKRLFRNKQKNILAGVCAGLAEYFNLNLFWVRAIFLLFLSTGFGFILYFMLWMATPPNYNYPSSVQENKIQIQENIDHNKTETLHSATNKKSQDPYIILGFFFILFGLALLVDELEVNSTWLAIKNIWPLAIIIPGALMVTKSIKK